MLRRKLTTEVKRVLANSSAMSRSPARRAVSARTAARLHEDRGRDRDAGLRRSRHPALAPFLETVALAQNARGGHVPVSRPIHDQAIIGSRRAEPGDATRAQASRPRRRGSESAASIPRIANLASSAPLENAAPPAPSNTGVAESSSRPPPINAVSNRSTVSGSRLSAGSKASWSTSRPAWPRMTPNSASASSNAISDADRGVARAPALHAGHAKLDCVRPGASRRVRAHQHLESAQFGCRTARRAPAAQVGDRDSGAPRASAASAASRSVSTTHADRTARRHEVRRNPSDGCASAVTAAGRLGVQSGGPRRGELSRAATRSGSDATNVSDRPAPAGQPRATRRQQLGTLAVNPASVAALRQSARSLARATATGPPQSRSQSHQPRQPKQHGAPSCPRPNSAALRPASSTVGRFVPAVSAVVNSAGRTGCRRSLMTETGTALRRHGLRAARGPEPGWPPRSAGEPSPRSRPTRATRHR